MKKFLAISLFVIICVLMLTACPSNTNTTSNTSTTSSIIQIGDYMMLGKYINEPILWRCVDIDANGPLMLSDRIITVKPFDAKGNHTYLDGTPQADPGGQRLSNGSNLWETSNIRSWLNSTATAGNVLWPDGCPPTAANVLNGYNDYANEKGFLVISNFAPSEQNIMRNVTQKSLLNNVDVTKLSIGGTVPHTYWINIATIVQNYTSAYYHNVTDKMFLLDINQLYRVYQHGNILGNNYWMGKPTQKAVDNSDYPDTDNLLSVTKLYSNWLRTPRGTPDSSNQYVRLVVNWNVVHGGLAYSGKPGIRPAFYLEVKNVIFSSGNGKIEMPYTVSIGDVISSSVPDSSTIYSSQIPTPALTPTPTLSPTPALTPTPTLSLTPTLIPSLTPMPTQGMPPTPGLTPTLIPSKAPSLSPTPRLTPTPTLIPAKTPTPAR